MPRRLVTGAAVHARIDLVAIGGKAEAATARRKRRS
jgi:hypothetical protein